MVRYDMFEIKLRRSNRKPEIFRNARALYEKVEQDNKQSR